MKTSTGFKHKNAVNYGIYAGGNLTRKPYITI